jgi:hypothetical protein
MEDLSGDDLATRARRLAAVENPLVAELYELHARACEEKLGRPKGSGRVAQRHNGRQKA